MNTTGKIGLACFLGSFIGALMALQFHLFWWIGVIIGGAIGYISYSFKEIPATVKRVWTEMPEPKVIGKSLINVSIETGKSVLGALVAILAVVVLVIAIALWFNSLKQACLFIYGGFDVAKLYTSYWYWVGGTLIMYIFVLLFLIADGGDRILGFRIASIAILAGTPALSFITVPAVVLLIAGVALWLVRHLLWRTIKLVHSDIRLLCMMDSLVGALVGYFTGNALIGGLVGCALGVVDYKLVSVRFLKLAPKPV